VPPCTRLGAAALGALALSGCRSYEPRPLDAAAHQAAWLARSPGDEGVAAFAERIARESPAGEGAAFDLGDGLSLREAEAVALFYNPDLRLARLRADVALASATYAGLWEDPELGIDAEHIVESVEHPWVLGAALGITIPLSGRTGVERDRATAAHRAAIARVQQQEWEVRGELRRTWLRWSAEGLIADLARERLARLDGVVAIVERLEAAEELSRIEARAFRLERAAAQADLYDLDAAAAESELSIRSLMGLSPRAPLSLAPAGLANTGDTRAGSGHEFSEGNGEVASNPLLTTLRAEYEAAEEALRLEIRKQYPDLVIGPGYGTEDGDPRVLLGLSLPIPLWNRNQRGVAEAAAEREVAHAAWETTSERLIGDFSAAMARLSAARARREAMESGALPLAEQQESDARRVAELGQVDTLLMLDTLTRVYEIKTALVEARLAEALAAAVLHELVGPPAVHAGAETPAPSPPQGAAR
jgi:outer membrane protein, heavy metal efflux system